MTQLSDTLDAAIDRLVDDNTSRTDIMGRMATAAGISESTVGQILGGDIFCPPLRRLRGFARVLPITMETIQGPAEADGCEYDEKGFGVFCAVKGFDVQVEKFDKLLHSILAATKN
ncbi:MAG: hypothetical protein V3R83_12440 [Gammaproteobacteria bacterium]